MEYMIVREGMETINYATLEEAKDAAPSLLQIGKDLRIMCSPDSAEFCFTWFPLNNAKENICYISADIHNKAILSPDNTGFWTALDLSRMRYPQECREE